MPIDEPAQLRGFTARMMELVSTKAKWHRRLWRGGTMELAQEFLSDSIRPGARENAITERRKHLMHAVQADHGVADHGKRIETVARSITAGVDATSHPWINLNHHIEEMNASYLTDWAQAFDVPPANRPIDTEGAARRVTAHILAAGMHKSSLYSWLRSVQTDDEVVSLGDFAREADRRLKAPKREYTFCVPVDKKPPFSIDPVATPHWMTSSQTVVWKQSHAPTAQTVRHQGAFLLQIEARDVNAAADSACDVITHLNTKFHLGARNSLQVCPWMWSKEKHSGFPTQSTNRLIRVTSFERLGQLQDLSTVDYLANTLALVEPLRTGAPHIAVISGWSAIESLMVGPSDTDDVVAARRISLIVAASVMRAEFTHLAKAYAEENTDETAKVITACTENIDRAKIFQQLAIREPDLKLKDMSDQLALERVRPALLNPRQEVLKIVDILTREFTRLYRKRNMVVHGGQIDGANLHSISDTLTPLIGTAIDRIADAQLKFSVSPIQLSAVAEARVHYLTPATTDSSGGLLELLEHSPTQGKS